MRADAGRGIALIAAVAGALAATPAAGQLFGGDDLARRQIAEQAKRIEALKAQGDALAERVARLEEAMKGVAAANMAIEIAQQLELLRQELRQLRGQVELLGNEVQAAAKRQRDFYVDLDARLKHLEQPPAAGAAAAPGSAAEAEARAYEAAQNQRRIGNYQGAIAAFQSFIAQYPKSPLAPRAQYWIGDSYYNLRDFKSSIAAQQKLIATYPDSSSVPDALLNMASSLIELGDVAAARKTMEGLIARYPASEAAEKAKRRLAALK